MAYARYSQLAVEDIDAAAAYIALDNPNAARRFIKAVHDTSELLVSFPQLSAIYAHPDHPDLRAKLVDGFRNYVIFYSTSGDHIEIIRVLHLARNIPRVLDQ